MSWNKKPLLVKLIFLIFNFIILPQALASNSKNYSKNVKKNQSIKVVYGEDDRLDLYQVAQPEIVTLAKSTAVLVIKDSLIPNLKGYQIKSELLGESHGLCKAESFYNQPSVGLCSAFLVGKNLIATAGHCISEFSCSERAFVFDFEMLTPNSWNNQISGNKTYFCKKIIARDFTNQQDYALVELDRDVVDREPLILQSNKIQLEDELFMTGHPSGIPNKVTFGGSVRTIDKNYFVANMDSFGGNSGSPVFNSRTNEVVGIMVRGEMDYDYDTEKECNRVFRCEKNQCRGEDVSNIQFIIKALLGN